MTGPVFVLRVQMDGGTDAIKILRLALKVLWRRHRIRCLSILQENEDSP